MDREQAEVAYLVSLLSPQKPKLSNTNPSSTSTSQRKTNKKPKTKNPNTTPSFPLLHRLTYLFLLLIALIGQIATGTLLLTSQLFPSIFAPEINNNNTLHLTTTFLPRGITPSTKMPSAVPGGLQLLQYDELVGSTAMSLWAVVLFVRSMHGGSKAGIDYWEIGSLILVFTGLAVFT